MNPASTIYKLWLWASCSTSLDHKTINYEKGLIMYQPQRSIRTSMVILCVNFTCLRGPRLNILSGYAVRVFLDDISIWNDRLSEVDGPPQCGWPSSNPQRAWVEQKAKGKGSSFFLLPHYFSQNITFHLLLPLQWDLYHQFPYFSGLHTQTILHHHFSWVSSLQRANHGTS